MLGSLVWPVVNTVISPEWHVSAGKSAGICPLDDVELIGRLSAKSKHSSKVLNFLNSRVNGQTPFYTVYYLFYH